MANTVNYELAHELTRDLFNAIFLNLSHDENDDFEDVPLATMAATNLLEMGGFDLDDSDAAGMELGTVTHSLLSMAMHLCPQLRDRINGDDDTVRIVAEDI